VTRSEGPHSEGRHQHHARAIAARVFFEKPAQSRRSQTTAHGACNRPAVTSSPPLLPRPAGERAGSHAGGKQPRQVGAPLRLQRAQHGGPVPRVMQPARRLLRVSNCTATHATTAPPRLRSQSRDSRQPYSASQVRRTKAVKIGPAVMAVTGGQKQRSRRQPSSRPIQGQRGSPLPRREDGAPVIRSSNGSRTRNGRPANRSPRRINSAAGQAAPQAGEASERFDFAIMSASKKVRHVIRLRIFFLFLFLSYNRDRERGIHEKDPSP
jgi:hypothetical protein